MVTVATRRWSRSDLLVSPSNPASRRMLITRRRIGRRSADVAMRLTSTTKSTDASISFLVRCWLGELSCRKNNTMPMWSVHNNVGAASRTSSGKRSPAMASSNTAMLSRRCSLVAGPNQDSGWVGSPP